MTETNFELERRIADIAVQLGAIKTVLSEKGIVTREDFYAAEQSLKVDPVIKERLEWIEIGSKLQAIMQKEPVTDEDIQWVKENATKYDSEEDVKRLVQILEWKKDPIFGKLFGAV